MLKLIYKEKNISSYKKIKNFAFENNIKKIGHSGTIDPIATGLLFVATDEDTKILNLIQNKNKTYIAKARLGFNSSTYDSEGILEKVKTPNINFLELEKILQNFIGEQLQFPPRFSAKKINGQRAYDLARKNISFELKPNFIKIISIKLLNFDGEFFDFEVEVSNGTYIRSLIFDIGKLIGCGAYMCELERTKIHGLDQSFLNKTINYDDILSFSKIYLKEEELWKIIHGKEIKFNFPNDWYMIIYENDFLGIIELENSLIKKRNILGKKFSNYFKKE
ncbi:MAG: tRNA pseudouridine(55) synthase TruB [Metamycoplasmataceae bacterium]